MPSNRVLNIFSINKSFNGEKILNNLSLELYEGKILGLIGSNGAGKTTTIKCISNILNIDSGKIEIFNKTYESNEIEIKQNIGILFENMDDLFQYLTGTEHLEIVGKFYGLTDNEIKKRTNELLFFFDIHDYKNLLIEKYSKGMKKKIALASILLYNPEFIILDEPFDGLDTLTTIKIKNLIKTLKEKGKTFLITSHILSYIEDLADEVAIINEGKIIFHSPIKDIRNRIKNEITKSTYQSLEEIFIDLTNGKEPEKTLSWL